LTNARGENVRKSKKPRANHSGIPFFIPFAKLPIHEERDSFLSASRSSGSRVVLRPPFPSIRQWLRGFRTRSRRRVRSGFSPLSLTSHRDYSSLSLLRIIGYSISPKGEQVKAKKSALALRPLGSWIGALILPSDYYSATSFIM
jgi:hypothetical protein